MKFFIAKIYALSYSKMFTVLGPEAPVLPVKKIYEFSGCALHWKAGRQAGRQASSSSKTDKKLRLEIFNKQLCLYCVQRGREIIMCEREREIQSVCKVKCDSTWPWSAMKRDRERAFVSVCLCEITKKNEIGRERERERQMIITAAHSSTYSSLSHTFLLSLSLSQKHKYCITSTMIAGIGGE